MTSYFRFNFKFIRNDIELVQIIINKYLYGYDIYNFLSYIGSDILIKLNINTILNVVDTHNKYLELLPLNIIEHPLMLEFLMKNKSSIKYIKTGCIPSDYLTIIMMEQQTLKDIPKFHQTKYMINYMLSKDFKNEIKFVNQDLLDDDMIIYFIKRDKSLLKYINKDLLTDNIIKYLLNYDKSLLKYISLEKITEDIFKISGVNIINEEINECVICKDEEEKYFIAYNCTHKICFNCHLKSYEHDSRNICYFRCKTTGFDYSTLYLNTNYKN